MYSQINILYPKRCSNGSAIIADQSLAVSTVAVTPVGYTETSVALVTFDVQGGTVRARWEGTAPTSSSGHALAAGSAYTWNVDMFNNCQFIRQDATDAVIFSSPLPG